MFDTNYHLGCYYTFIILWLELLEGKGGGGETNPREKITQRVRESPLLGLC